MIIRRTLLIIASILAILVAGGATILTGGQLARTINWVLPTGWQVEIPHRLESHWENATLPHFALSYQDCPLLKTDNFRVQWVEPLGISLQKATVDYACLATLPKSESSSALDLESLKNSLAWLPQGSVNIEQLAWENLPTEMPLRVKGLLALPSQIALAKKTDHLTACVHQPQLALCTKLQGLQLSGSGDYQPSEQEHHHLSFNATLPPTLFELPITLNADYEWQLPKTLVADPALQQGKSHLQWQQTGEQYAGQWHVQALAKPTNQLTFPFTIDAQSLAIEQGRVDWAVSDKLALRGFLTSKITPNSLDPANLFPIKTAIRLSLLSENEKGKGNVVINSPEGEWLADRFSLPVNIHGNIKQGNFILYSAVPLAVNGDYDSPTLRFLPKALLRVTGKERFLTIDDLRFPLAGIRVDKQRIHGRLQAIFRGESPDFKQIELHLDGYAKAFNAGLHTVFQPIKGQPENADRWQWRFWGKSLPQSVKSPLSVAGRGHWQGKVVQLSEFQGELGKIQQGGVTIPRLSLALLEPIIFAYEKWQLAGGLQLSAPKAQFQYGGELDKLTARLTFKGEVDNLNLKGEVVSGKLGPIRLFARRQLTEKSSNLLGRLYWSEQPLNVFQSLLPFRSNWVITQGTVRGETAFSATSEKGLVAGGHFAIRNGGFSFPSGELKGVEFALPYLFQQGEVDIGVKKALDVRIAEIKVGVPITNAKLKVQGHYPYSKKRPLFLRELSFELLSGRLNIERFALPQTKVAQLKLRHIQLEQILQLAQYHQLDLKGSIHATLPFWLSGKPCYICGGTFTQAGSSQLKFTPELLKAMEKSGYTEQLLTYLVNDSQISQLSGKIDLASNGEMQLHSSLKMFLNEHQNAKINLNYNHQENMFDLWKLINYGSQFEQNIEHSIYQKLDNR